MFSIVGGSKNVAPILIAWRNPHPQRPHRRRHSFEPEGGRALYILQEFVEDGQAGHWATISGLEVVVGGRAA
jgi:hypothetical protein